LGGDGGEKNGRSISKEEGLSSFTLAEKLSKCAAERGQNPTEKVDHSGGKNSRRHVMPKSLKKKDISRCKLNSLIAAIPKQFPPFREKKIQSPTETDEGREMSGGSGLSPSDRATNRSSREWRPNMGRRKDGESRIRLRPKSYYFESSIITGSGICG